LNEPVLLIKTEDNIEIKKPIERIDRTETTPDEVLRKSQERIKKLRELSMKIKTAQGLSELEKEPAYLRKNVVLADVTPSAESHVSRYSLSEDENKKVELKQNNSFLHDNVD